MAGTNEVPKKAHKEYPKIWCHELWMDWDDVDISNDSAPKYGPSETHYNGADQRPEEGYYLRGTGMVPDWIADKITDREKDYY